MINFRSVSKIYDQQSSSARKRKEGSPYYAVKDLDLEITEGKITVLVGPSGCGKSTTMRMINRMIEPTSGSIFIDQKNVADFKPYNLRRSIGYVMQSGGLLPNKTIEDNIATVPLLKKTNKSKAISEALDLMQTVGLDVSLAKRYPSQLSGGQQQRVGVARALASQSNILLMDEPFSAVDPIVRKELQEELLKLQKNLAKTIVFVTHDIDEAMLLGDKVAVMSAGAHIEQYDKPENILRNPKNSFVAEFIGHDRGVRRLSFEQAQNLPVYSCATIEESSLEEGLSDSFSREQIEQKIVKKPLYKSVYSPNSQKEDNWILVLKQNKPLAWLDMSASKPTKKPLGTLYTSGSSLRSALDACLSSGSNLGVTTDDQGDYYGVIITDDVVEATKKSS